MALTVLKGDTLGYRNHPQLKRFKSAGSPLDTLKCYLRHIYLEAEGRGYRFDLSKLGKIGKSDSLEVTRGQLKYEITHLKKKLKIRDPSRLKSLKQVDVPKAHPLFVPIEGDIEEWERGKH